MFQNYSLNTKPDEKLILTYYITDFIECKETTEKVIQSSTADNLQPFKDKMESFLEEASGRVESKFVKLEKSQIMFKRTIKFYKFQPKSGSFDDCTPQQFFELWSPFVNDFRAIWNKHVEQLTNEL